MLSPYSLLALLLFCVYDRVKILEKINIIDERLGQIKMTENVPQNSAITPSECYVAQGNI